MELIYFKIADRFKIIDRPNARSSHNDPVIRGGGVIFVITLWLWFAFNFQWPYFICAVSAIAAISFADDIKPQPAITRFVIQILAVLTIFFETGLFQWSVGLLIVACVVCIGTLNACNFMDGINGITGINSLVFLGTCVFINENTIEFTNHQLLISLVIAVVVFLYFNFRKRAKCFAGDVGSVTMAFVQIFFLLQLIQKTGSLFWAGMFFVFGVDSVITIAYRIKRKENIFKPHRTHLYQFLSNELKWDHRLVSILYGLVQLMFNIVLIASIQNKNSWMVFGSGLVALTAYFFVRISVTRRIVSLRS